MGEPQDTTGQRGEPAQPLTPAESPPVEAKATPARRRARGPAGFFRIRSQAHPLELLVYGALCIVVILGIWWFVTRGESSEDRIVPYFTLQSPAETFGSFHSLWFDRALTRNLLASLRRVVLGFSLAALVGVPLGVLCGCFTRVNAFFAPLSIFGRNIPIAALVPLTFALFGIDEFQKVMFIFIACVAFILSDTAQSVRDVSGAYIDTAYTLGASRTQVILKVLFPLALPAVFNSLRLLFGIAFGYIMLTEVISRAEDPGGGGLGNLINISQHRGPKEHTILVLIIIPIVALVLDRILFWVQKELFPYRYGGEGTLSRGVKACKNAWDDLKSLIFRGRAKKTGGTP